MKYAQALKRHNAAVKGIKAAVLDLEDYDQTIYRMSQAELAIHLAALDRAEDLIRNSCAAVEHGWIEEPEEASR